MRLEIEVPPEMANCHIKYAEALRNFPAKGQRHNFLMTPVNYGLLAGVSPERIEIDLLNIAPDMRGEISEAIQKGLSTVRILPKIQRHRRMYSKSDGEKQLVIKDGRKALCALIEPFIVQDENTAEYDLWEASPYRLTESPGCLDSEILLSELYKPDDFIFIGQLTDTGKDNIRTAAGWVKFFSNGKNPAYPFICPNPLTGETAECKAGKLSYRCDSAIKDFSFAIVEFDSISRIEQLAFIMALLNMKVPLACVIDSGNKSLHIWLRVNCRNVPEWNSNVRQKLFEELLKPMGADNACKNQSRCSRLPGHIRKETGKYQRLLYLNPDEGILK